MPAVTLMDHGYLFGVPNLDLECRKYNEAACAMKQYTLHFKYQAVLHYLHIRSQQRTADHYGISRTHLRRWICAYQEGGIGALEHPKL